MMSSLMNPRRIISKVKDLCQRLEYFGIEVRDARKRPLISPVTIFKSFILIPILRLKSLNQLDNSLRQPEVRGFIGSKRKMVVSDSTMERSLKGFALEPLRKILKSVVRFARARGYHKLTLSSGRELIGGIVDGSTIGKKLCSVFYEIGKVNLLVDVERIKKRGKELEASWKLVEKYLADVDILIVDGLYYVKHRINWIRSQGKHILIKTKEKRFVLIREAEEFFKHYEDFKDEVEYYEGVQVMDDGKKFSYKVWAIGELRTEGIDYPLKVAKVEMVNLIKNTQETYYLITTQVELTGLEMKEIGQLRWRIENSAFKKGNEQFSLKHAFINDDHGWEAMTLILFIGFNLFGMIKTQLTEEGVIQAIRRVTYKYVSQIIQSAMTAVYVMDQMLCPDSS